VMHMPKPNRLTNILGIEPPILLAPMDVVSGGKLAAAVSQAGGLEQNLITLARIQLR
jgi:NAD(P)H-dependent flavin oxidoreductase YrpB (nitropropane dioxygenase family)